MCLDDIMLKAESCFQCQLAMVYYLVLWKTKLKNLGSWLVIFTNSFCVNIPDTAHFDLPTQYLCTWSWKETLISFCESTLATPFIILLYSQWSHDSDPSRSLIWCEAWSFSSLFHHIRHILYNPCTYNPSSETTGLQLPILPISGLCSDFIFSLAALQKL